MAPGLNGRQTGTVPKNKPKNSGSQSHRSTREPFLHSSLLDWEPMSDLGNKSHSRKKSGTTYSEVEAESLQRDLGRSRSSTMTSQIEIGEGCSQDSLSNKMNVPDRKQVISKLSQIQSYVQQTAALMNALKASDSPNRRNQYEKLSIMLEDLKDSETKLSALLNKMDSTESRIDSLLVDLEEQQGNNNLEADEEELTRRSEESAKKLEVLQKRKQDLLKLQEKAKRQLQEAQAEQSRLVARASSINHELSANKAIDLNVQQLRQRLKAVQQIYNTRNQITDNLISSRRTNREEAEHPDEDQTETSDTETDLQLVADKMEELTAMKAQLGQIQKLMASINGIQNGEMTSSPGETSDDMKDQTNRVSQNYSSTDGEQNGEDGNNKSMEVEQAKSKLNQLTQLLEIVQSAQNTSGLPSSYLQLVSNLVNMETASSSHSPSPVESVRSPERNCEDVSVETMQVMTRELEQTTVAMKEERDRLLAARQELQDIARRLPMNKPEIESFSPDDFSESEPPCLKPATSDSNSRDVLNGSVLTEAEQSSNCTDGSLYLCRTAPARNRQRGTWNASLPGSNSTIQERQSKNESLSRGSNHSSRGGSRTLGRDQSGWSPSPSVSYCNDRSNAVVQTQNQLEMSTNLCDMMLAESFQRGVRPNEISLQDMFAQHQLLTRTVAQCSQLLWFQQKQIVELRNAFMLQYGALPSLQSQQIAPLQPHTNIPPVGNPPFSSLSNVPPSMSNVNQAHSMAIQQHQNQSYHPVNQNVKLNAGDIQSVQMPHQDLSEQFLHHVNQNSLQFSAPEVFGCDMRCGNFNRYNPSTSQTNQNVNQNVSSGSSNRVPNGMNCMGPEDSGALNNQVPPGNRANNYWDNFRSYSRQNLLSYTKSNEDTDVSRRCMASASIERSPRDTLVQPPLQNNNQSTVGTSQQPVHNSGNLESTAADQYLLPPSQNTRVNHHSQVTRSRSVEPQNYRNTGKNESRHQDNDSRNFNVAGKNEGSGGARSRNPDCGSENIRSVRNDVNQSLRNVDNLNNTRNFIQLVRDFDNEEVPQGNNKKRPERSRHRNEGLGVLNNRGYHNSDIWENISSEVSNFIRVNETRPHFLLQLFRDLQQVTTDNLRQRTLESIQEMVNANNLTERTSTMNGGNVNIIENRNNIRGNRSNLNRNQSEDPTRIDELFCHLRENQNTIRQNIGMSSFVLGGNNLGNPNISNIRDLGNSRNNLENEGLRDLRTYFEASLCNFGHNSTLENPNLSNIRENLTRRGPGVTDLENVNPKNVYLSIYDNAAVELRRRNQESGATGFGSPYRNFEVGNDYLSNEMSGNSESVRGTNDQFELENSFEGGAVGDRAHFQHENRPTDSRFQILDGGDNFARPNQYLGNGNDSGIDINFNNDERKRGYVEGDSAINNGAVKTKKNESISEVEGAAALILPQWERSGERDTFDSSVSLSRNDMTSPFIPICENSFFNCRSFQQSDDGDLAEADQSRNEETSGAESDSGFINAQIVEPETGFVPDQSHQSPTNNFVNRNVPESERSFIKPQFCENDSEVDGAVAVETDRHSGFPNSASEPEGNFTRTNDSCESLRKNEKTEVFYYQLSASSSSEGTIPKTGTKHKKKVEEAAEKESSGNLKKSSKNATNRHRESSFGHGKLNGFGPEDYESPKSSSEAGACGVDGRLGPDARDSSYHSPFQRGNDKSAEAEKSNTSPEADSDWECGGGLDQLPTRLKKSGSSRKPEDSGGSVP